MWFCWGLEFRGEDLRFWPLGFIGLVSLVFRSGIQVVGIQYVEFWDVLGLGVLPCSLLNSRVEMFGVDEEALASQKALSLECCYIAIISWVLVREIGVSYRNMGTMLFAIDP